MNLSHSLLVVCSVILSLESIVLAQKDTPAACGLYMAESSIPDSGWGMYTGVEIPHGSPVPPLDVVIQVADYARQMKHRAKFTSQEELPLWLMEEYYWKPQTTWAWHDARKVQSIVPGLGMLANSHPGLVNLREQGPKWKQSVERDAVEAGAYTQYKNTTFLASTDIPKGHELMVQYGDHWFEVREYAFGGAIPLSGDYKEADEIVQEAAKQCNDTLDSDFCQELWNKTRQDALNTTTPRVYSALPEVLTKQAVEHGTARHSVPNVVRSIEWLEENGMCLDHIVTRDNSTIPHAGSGAFATRFLKKGTIVAPAPVVHLHRGHLDIFFTDTHDPDLHHWRGHQLLLNYVYGHASTSLVFFPYSPGVNHINHSPDSPNVEIRWSSRMSHKEWFNLTTQQLIQDENKHAGLMMEIVALRDIQEGEEILLNYGSDWQEAWDKHVETWRLPLDSATHRPAEPFRSQKVLPTRADTDMEPIPSNAMTVCWVDWEDVEETDQPNTYLWLDVHETHDQTLTEPCTLLRRDKNEDGTNVYAVQMVIDGEKYIFVNVLRRGIDVVDKPYSANQFLRQSFRHEIQLPDDMIPEAWKDLEQGDDQCGLYMAESSIPNSGLGMFTGKIVKDSHEIAFPDIVIQSLDVDENNKLRHWYVGAEYDEGERNWLLDNYFWNPPYTGAETEARDVQSIVPGIGMLANSHTGAVNAISRLPFRDNSGLLPQNDPGAGASTTYHDMRFMAYNGDMPAGAEIFVEYGDHWFLDQEARLGVIPLSDDFREADAMLVEFWETIGGDPDAPSSKKEWERFLKEAAENVEEERVYLALPQKLEDVESILDTGTALYNVRDSIKSIEWLEENGRCLDNIKPGTSSIPHAGRGAFATRRIQKGDMIAPAPLVQLEYDQMLIMESNDIDNPKSKIWVRGTQQILNYCFGHENSTILLYPYSPVVNYINHDSENYNAELRWSELPNHQSDWLNRSVDELVELGHSGLIMEFVATRDIRPHEEILINYGDRWQKAWDDYVQSWKPDPEYKRYTPAWEFNDYTMPVRTAEEQKIRPYPEHVWIGCYISEVDESQSGEIVDGHLEYKWEYYPSLYHTTLAVTECQIESRYKEYVETADSIRPVGELYKVRVWKHHQMSWIIADVPRRAIEFFDKTYESELVMAQPVSTRNGPSRPHGSRGMERCRHDKKGGDDKKKTHSTTDEL